ncbi:MAG: undecaprenyl-diphosphatase UppP [Chloroflexota bacterium]
MQAAILGVVQGLTEFLPISSSGHLILVPWLLGWREHSLTFDLALHLGTAMSLLAYFWREWARLGMAVLAGLRNRAAWSTPEWHLAWMLVGGSAPAAVAGLLFEKVIEENVRQPWLVGILLIVFGVALWFADRAVEPGRSPRTVRWRDTVVVGCAQVLALLPGVSRSGVTITAGLLLGLDRAGAARFSFLLSAPIIFGAALYKLRILVKEPLAASEAASFVLGAIVAAVVGAAAIGFLLRMLARSSLLSFVVYRVIVGVAAIALSFSGR